MTDAAVEILPRSTWTDRAPDSVSPLDEFRYWFVHWTGTDYSDHMTDTQVLQSIQRYHMDTKGWSDIAYSFAVGQDGRVYELRGWGIKGGHTRTENHRSMAVVFLIGPGEYASPEMLAAAARLFEEGRKRGYVNSSGNVVVMGHRHDPEASTTCPGPELSAWAWDYNHDEDYIKRYAPIRPYTDPLKSVQQAPRVERLYKAILGRPSDPEGLAHWSKALHEGNITEHDLLIEFLAVRFEADRSAELNDDGEMKGIDPKVFRDLFYEELLEAAQRGLT